VLLLIDDDGVRRPSSTSTAAWLQDPARPSGGSGLELVRRYEPSGILPIWGCPTWTAAPCCTS
jgi:hypothetical protein